MARSPLTGIQMAIMAGSPLMGISRAAVTAGSLPLADSRLTITLTVPMPCRRKSRIQV